ncbi:MAG: AMP-binding protein, partial [Myxococcota bacterium]
MTEKTAPPVPEPLPFTLQFQAHHNPDKTAIIDGDLRRTFRELNIRVNRLANALASAGLQRNDRVAVLMHNRAEWAEVLYAMQKLKCSAVPIGYRLKGPEIAYIMNNSEAKALIAGEAFLDAIAPVMAGFQHLRNDNVIILGETVPSAFKPYEGLLESASEEEPDSDHAETSSTIIYTSGTTGMPKGAFRENQPRDLDTLMDIIGGFGFTMNDVHHVACPIYHSAPMF